MLDARWKTSTPIIEANAKKNATDLDSELKAMGVHLRLKLNYVRGWQEKFEKLANYSRSGDLKGARERFLD